MTNMSSWREVMQGGVGRSGTRSRYARAAAGFPARPKEEERAKCDNAIPADTLDN